MDAILDAVFPISPQVFVGVLVAVVMVHAILGTIPLLIYFERKISAYIQDRMGPNRVGFDLGLPFLKKITRGFGFWGLGQSLADGLKFILKEDYMPKGADKALFTLAPALAVIPAFIGWAIIPWGGQVDIPSIAFFGREWVSPGLASVMVADINVGFVYLLAIASLGIYGVTLGGWASNNKFSFLGGLRASAGMISYEVPMGLTILATLLLVGSFSPSVIVEDQVRNGWYLLAQPIACVLFFVCILAESNRAPFDNAEAEQELVGGFHTEYSAMRFALFFLAEYAHMMTSSAFFALLFLGGYHVPFIELTSPEATGFLAAFVKLQVFMIKVVGLVIFMMFIRWTVPRIRYDQVLKLCWGSLIPLSLVLVVATSIMVKLGLTPRMLVDEMGIFSWVPMAGMNIVLLIGLFFVAPLLFDSRTVNKKVALAGSRFSPLREKDVSTAPESRTALDDDNPFKAARPV